MNKREWLAGINDPDLKVTAASFLDRVEQSGKYHEKVFTAFLSPVERLTCEKLYWQCGESIVMKAFGGHVDCEYQMIGLAPDYMGLEDLDFPIVLVIARVKAKEHDLTHRDVLGALMSLGFKRNRIGDLWISGNDIQILCDEEMAGYVTAQLEKIGRYGVEVSTRPLEEIVLPEMDKEEVFKTVASLRLDAILSAGFNMSRGTACDLIEGEKVKVNHIPETRSNHFLKEGDLIACRGKGRMILTAIEGNSKKDRIKVRLTKML